jgi:atypical dual specificity phosphatase
MPIEAIQKVRARLQQDRAFYEQLINSPRQTLSEYDLTEEETRPFIAPNFSWLIEQRLAGVAFPRSEDALTLLQQEGVRALLTLSERTVDPALLARYSLQMYHLPVADFTAPTLNQIEQAMAVIDEFQAQNLPVAVHCAAGLGRTGTILACYLVAQGNTSESAIEQIRRQRPGSIETSDQEAIIHLYEQILRERSER